MELTENIHIEKLNSILGWNEKMFSRRNYRKGDSEKVIEIILKLKKYYPDIENWLKDEMEKINKGIDNCVVACLDGEIVAVGIYGNKGRFSVKLKTFKVKDEFQGLAIGPYLLDYIIEKCVEQKIRRIYVTFAEEEVDELLPFFQEYGFLFDGLAPFAYRENVSEYITGKLQIYEEINESQFKDLVENFLYRLRGYKIEESGEDYLVVRKTITAKESYKIYVKIITITNVKKGILNRVDDEAKEFDCESKHLVTYYPLGFANDRPDIKVFDCYDMETYFYPLVLKKKGNVGIITPIEKGYADRIFFTGKQTILFPDKKSLRSDNVFFKSPNVKDVKRGDICVLYEMSPTKAIIGEGRIKDASIDTPENLFEKYKEKGVVSLKFIKDCADSKNEVLAIWLGKKIRYKVPLTSKKILDIIPKFNPQGTLYISQDEIDKIRKVGGVKVE